MKVQKTIEVWLVKKRLPRPIDVVQGDKGIQLVFTVQDFTIPGGTTATLYVQKPSGKFVYQETGITVSGNTITIDLENQAIIEHGNSVPYQVQLKNGADDVTTFAGIFRVEKSLKDAGAEESKTVIAAFEAKTAEQVAQIEAAAQEQIALIQAEFPELYAMKDQVTMLTNSTANAIKGKLSGAVVFADDVSPVEHNPVVKVHGKNLLNPIGASKTQNGVTFTNNGNGTFSVNGTSTNPITFALTNILDYPIYLKKGKAYTQSVEITEGEGATHHIVPSVVDESGIVTYNYFNGNQTRTADKDYEINAYSFYIGTNVTVNFTFRVQLEEGNAATDYEPYIDPSTVTVKRCGRNMVTYPYNEMSLTRGGVTFTVANDGRVTASGTSTGAYLALVSTADKAMYLHKDHTYFFSCVPSGGGFNTYYAYVAEEDGETFFDHGSGVKVTPTKSGYASITVVVKEGTTVSNVVFKPLLEVGESATAFEPYNGAEYAPAADGTVSGITSLSPSMTILTDTEGVIVECEYNRDTNKAFASYVLTAEAKAEIVAEVEDDMAEVLASLNEYAESLIGGDA